MDTKVRESMASVIDRDGLSSKLQAFLDKLKPTEFPMAQRELRTHSGGDKDGLCRVNTLQCCLQRVRKQATVASPTVPGPASLGLS